MKRNIIVHVNVNEKRKEQGEKEDRNVNLNVNGKRKEQGEKEREKKQDGEKEINRKGRRRG